MTRQEWKYLPAVLVGLGLNFAFWIALGLIVLSASDPANWPRG
jgi:hypothetical protein